MSCSQLPEETETLPAIPMSETSLTPDLRNLLQSILEGMAQGLLRVEEVEFGLKLLEKKG